MFCVIWGYSISKEKAKQFKQKTSLSSYKLKSNFSIILGWLNQALNNLAQEFCF